MLYHLLARFADSHTFFNLFRYITFRALGAMVTALLVALWTGPELIAGLRTLKFGQVIRDDGPQSHLKKAGTPTMGGLIILAAAGIGTLLWANLTTTALWVTLATFVGMGAIGFTDDYLKVVRNHPDGLVAAHKLTGQTVLALVIAHYLLGHPLSSAPASWTVVPFLPRTMLAIPAILFLPWVVGVFAGTSNAVNLTDGLDGLASGLATIVAGTFAVFAYLIGRVDAAHYLGLVYIPGAGELAVFCAALAGALLGFLWFNAHPAEVFMGDTGSLAIGGAIGAIALLLKSELLLVVVGGVFVAEAGSVMLQVGFFKWTARRYGEGRRLFRMAPLHHHFEKCGLAESKVIARFWIVGILCALLGLAALKLR